MNYKLEYFRKMRLKKKEIGQCYYCSKPIFKGVTCEYHYEKIKKNGEKARSTKFGRDLKRHWYHRKINKIFNDCMACTK